MGNIPVLSGIPVSVYRIVLKLFIKGFVVIKSIVFFLDFIFNAGQVVLAMGH